MHARGHCLVEIQAFKKKNLNHKNQISVSRHRMVLQELTITLEPKLDTILDLDWSNDLLPADPAQIINPSPTLLPPFTLLGVIAI